VRKIFWGWFCPVQWQYYDDNCWVCTDIGAYLISDSGYLPWPEAICPYSGEPCQTLEGYFSTNLESVQKDVECTFGILKKRWRVLNSSMLFRDIGVCEKIFVACCCLHNFLLEVIECNDVRIGRGAPLGNDCMWLDGHTTPPDVRKSDQIDAIRFGWRRTRLATHLREHRDKGPIEES
jgi:hypothetical protein